MMTNRQITGLLAAFLLMASSIANAVTLRMNGTGEIVGFDNVEVDGQQWHATFFNVVDQDFKVVSQQDAVSLTNAIVNSLNSGTLSGTKIDVELVIDVVGFEASNSGVNYTTNRFATPFMHGTTTIDTYDVVNFISPVE